MASYMLANNMANQENTASCDRWQTSTHSRVKSGVFQSTVLGPIMFLLYINDIGQNIPSKIQLFANDCVLYRVIKSPQDEQALQENLAKVSTWANTVPDYYHNFNQHAYLKTNYYKMLLNIFF